MAKTSAERQAEFRLRRNDEGNHKRINMLISSDSHKALARLSKHHKTTLAEMIERLIAVADGATTKTLGNDLSKTVTYLTMIE